MTIMWLCEAIMTVKKWLLEAIMNIILWLLEATMTSSIVVHLRLSGISCSYMKLLRLSRSGYLKQSWLSSNCYLNYHDYHTVVTLRLS